MPVWMSCIDPRAFALHKYWLSKQDGRESIKKRRDAVQGAAVAQIAERLGLKFNQKELSGLPLRLVSPVERTRQMRCLSRQCGNST